MKIRRMVLMAVFIGLSTNMLHAAALDKKTVLADINAMVKPDHSGQAAEILMITEPVNDLCAVMIRPPFREFPNILIYTRPGKQNRWERLFEGLCLGLQPYKSDLVDLHTNGKGVDFTLKGLETNQFNYETKNIIIKSQKAGADIIAYKSFMHMHPAGQSFYTLDKTRFYDLALKLFGDAYADYPKDQCLKYDTPGLIDMKLTFTDGQYRLETTTDNSQLWKVSFVGVEKGRYLAGKNVEAFVLNNEEMIAAYITQRLRKDAIETERLGVADRIAELDYAFGSDLKEHRALQGYGIMLVGAVSRKSEELPLAGAYFMVGGKKHPLQKIKDIPRKVTDPTIVKVLGSHRVDSYFYIPYTLTREPANLYLDWKTGRKDFGLKEFPDGDALSFVKDPSYIGGIGKIDKKTLKEFFKREFGLESM